jgi:hypothetical protein
MYAFEMDNHETLNSAEPLLLTSLPGMTLMRRGKDKDVYDLGDMLLMVSTDRLTVPGKILGQGVKCKGKVVNQLSTYWFRNLRKIFPNHLVSANSRDNIPYLPDKMLCIIGEKYHEAYQRIVCKKRVGRWKYPADECRTDLGDCHGLR